MNDRYVVSVSPKLGTSEGGSRTVRERLTDADPLAEGPLSELDAQRMRRTIIEAANERAMADPIGWKASWAAVTLAAAATAVFAVNHWREPNVGPVDAPTAAASRATPESRRQLQFVAPGGTRVIWVFNADFTP